MTRMPIDSNLKHAVSLGTPVEVFDPTTNEVFYLLSAEQFHKMAVVHGDVDPRDAYPVVDKIMAEDDSHDPLLASYQ
jgi:hypothetical protein